MKKISIVVPVYNVEEYLDKCLNSLVTQTVDDYKIIIVNDGTKDDSQKIIDRYQKKYSNLITSYIKENGGLSDARNFGLKHVDTPYVMFVDSDDYVENNLIEKCIETINKEDADIVVFNYKQHNLSNDSFEEIDSTIEGTYNLSSKKDLLAHTPNAAWNKLYKTSLFRENDISYPKGLWYEDLATTPILLHKANKISYIKDYLYIYQANRPNNIMSTVSEKTSDIIIVLGRIVNYFKKENVFNEYYNELRYLCIRNLIMVGRIVLTSKDQKYVKQFIRLENKFLRENFSKKQFKYKEDVEKGDRIYHSSLLSKSYYKVKKILS